MVLIGLTATARSGKDTFADHLVEQFDYIKMGWCDPLYQLATVIDPELVVGIFAWRCKKERLSSIVGRLGWTKAKEIPSVRQFLQVLGTEGVRECLGQDAWISASLPKIRKLIREGENVVITNCRFPNEGAIIKELGGWLIRVTRPGVGPVNNHVSDAGLVFDMADFEIENDGSIADLAPKAAELHDLLSDDLRIPEYGDTEAYVKRYEATVASALKHGLEAVLKVAMPIDADPDEWMQRHQCKAWQQPDLSGDTTFTVEVDGEEAGELHYEDGILTVDIFVAR